MTTLKAIQAYLKARGIQTTIHNTSTNIPILTLTRQNIHTQSITLSQSSNNHLFLRIWDQKRHAHDTFHDLNDPDLLPHLAKIFTNINTQIPPTEC